MVERVASRIATMLINIFFPRIDQFYTDINCTHIRTISQTSINKKNQSKIKQKNLLHIFAKKEKKNLQLSLPYPIVNDTSISIHPFLSFLS